MQSLRERLGGHPFSLSNTQRGIQRQPDEALRAAPARPDRPKLSSEVASAPLILLGNECRAADQPELTKEKEVSNRKLEADPLHAEVLMDAEQQPSGYPVKDSPKTFFGRPTWDPRMRSLQQYAASHSVGNIGEGEDCSTIARPATEPEVATCKRQAGDYPTEEPTPEGLHRYGMHHAFNTWRAVAGCSCRPLLCRQISTCQ